MNLGERLFNLRKDKKLSQEEVAEKLNVTRQTVSKWETDQSLPDFDKIAPLCELYGISADELLTGKKKEEDMILPTEENNIDTKNDSIKSKRANGIGKGILLYFVAIAWIMIAIPVLKINPIVSSAIFLLICGISTYIIVYTCIVYKGEKKKKDESSKLQKQINEVIAMIFLIIYLLVSFITMAWHITWILWIVYGLIEEIVKLVFMLRGNKNEK